MSEQFQVAGVNASIDKSAAWRSPKPPATRSRWNFTNAESSRNWYTRTAPASVRLLKGMAD
jgi:hypothetical protein